MARSPPMSVRLRAPLPERVWPRRAALAAAVVAFGASSAWGQERSAHGNGLHGRLELQDAAAWSGDDNVETALGARTRNDAAADLRLAWEPSWGAWSAQVHYEATLLYGDGVPIARKAGGLLPAPALNWARLQTVLVDQGRTLATQRIDRLAIAWSSPNTVVRLGRQALTLGSGLVFRPMDLFNPFAPNAVDTEYKPGTDMLYVQRLFASGADLQLIVVPRPDRPGAQPTSHASSAALVYRRTIAGHQTTWMAAADHGDVVAALGVAGAWGGAAWNIEVQPTVLKHGGVRTSAIANISDAATLLGRNATVFAEYFHNGFGVAGDADYSLARLPPELLARLERGQLFTTRRNHLAAGLTLEATPLLTLAPTVLVDLDDPSAFLLGQATYSLGDNLTLVGGVQAPIGPHRSEYGGLPLAPSNPTAVAPSTRLYVQLRRYF